MRIVTVTMTGADDSVEPKRLHEIWKDYPFVEWGILFSTGRAGSARFPSRIRLRELHSVLRTGMPASAHLCGEYVRSMLCESGIEEHWFSGFQRFQLNFHGVPQHPDWLRLTANVGRLMRPVIIQMDGVNDAIYAVLRKSYPFTYPLFDRSGGTGIVPEQWPAPVDFCGYAGGLGPDNLEAELARIEQVTGGREIWIDMETKVRSEDGKVFDLDKIVRCLEIVEQFAKGGSA